ncbi:eukaryotic translation initiation factor 3-like protein [Volvox carteri f. nagariensis]|uniref:Eukaryotic translation initiation factor 3-like protein n=1 Tax=Volvox carteri f. nagariensis TaxID=3068 RepID=D8TKH1_VOLCA|nr:eukaryotic translation initiation factor 3-like protein [Volvox carteri f. nagariensis]EFJ52063.1 eukaryotic translation initiation factor 3-like protein [Volvox carteri f. nagariensis]|eukprot:XP_002946837.1 eukaryotic translation initiation factor 3-like protein [Volvox carteri f. nagariensis]
MADDLDDWETADIESDLSKPVSVAAKPAPAFETKGEAILAMINGPVMSQFEDEDKNFTAPVAHSVPAPQPKKKEEKKYREERVVIDTPLDDPIAEKLRQQKLVEQADFDAARELFGDASTLKPLESFLPKTLKEFEEFAAEIVARHVVLHRESKHYKAFVKALVKAAVEPLGPEEVKDVETSLAGVRSDKAKKKKEDEEKKKGVKKTLNMGKQGLSAGLDDYVYEDNGDEDEDFM